jgi:methylamine dehydrogenase accessory protein MauD
MTTLWLLADIASWVVILFLGFLLLGALRTLALLRWRLEQLEATTPTRIGRSGLRPGTKAPDFGLPSVAGGEVTLHQFIGRKVLLVFTQSGCEPCRQIMPELNRLQHRGEVQVLVVNNDNLDASRKWAEEAQAQIPIVAQERWVLSRRYEVFATPFAFLIDEQGIIRSKGIVSDRQYINFVVSGAGAAAQGGHEEAEPTVAEARVS